jgi:c(7)-type cytochrome triheme protein
MSHRALPSPLLVVAALTSSGLALAIALGAEGKTQKTVEKHGGNIVFTIARPTREIKDHVLFSHELHLSKGHVCKDCHNGKVFLEEKKMGVNEFTMKDITRGQACGSCHDGLKKAKNGQAIFAPQRNCTRCHNVKLRKTE